MKHGSRSSLVVPIVTGVVVALLLIAIVVASIRKASQQPSDGPRPTPSGTVTPEERRLGGGRITPGHPPPEAWIVPDTADPRRAAEAFARAIWTYDTTLHTWAEWREAVSAFAAPLAPPASGEVARSMLPLWPQWEETVRRGGRARVRSVRAVVTPELAALRRDQRAPLGWNGFWVTGDVVTAAEGREYPARREATVSVVCVPKCGFWSASAERPG
ncbi:hypothetical protein [Kribbella deserti]|uniref:Secreted protein n=1 Tax=Kribbella deserti TaxID=1926257 RepID=A0ABV6QS54_9ACTN